MQQLYHSLTSPSASNYPLSFPSFLFLFLPFSFPFLSFLSFCKCRSNKHSPINAGTIMAISVSGVQGTKATIAVTQTEIKVWKAEIPGVGATNSLLDLGQLSFLSQLYKGFIYLFFLQGLGSVREGLKEAQLVQISSPCWRCEHFLFIPSQHISPYILYNLLSL